MIKIQNKKDCCGCSACVQKCPKTCIRMKPDEEGFLYPSIDQTVCVDCGLCENVCPVINKREEIVPVITLAVKNINEEIRLKSSSGGVFSALAIKVLKDGGLVFGAKFNEKWEVVHDCIEEIDDLHLFQGSKYVQSAIGETFSQAKSFLRKGKIVLFSGTPCQIAGLKNFLGEEYLNLLTVEVVCHGTPSPMIWSDYLHYLIVNQKIKGARSLSDISSISFRSKVTGWKNSSFEIRTAMGNSFRETFNTNIFMKGFLNNLYLRPSCYCCPARKGRSGADISLADFWGVSNLHKGIDDDKGIGLVFANSSSGIDYLESIAPTLSSIESVYDVAVKYNPCIVTNVEEPLSREDFFNDYKEKKIYAIKSVCKDMEPSILKRCINVIKAILRTVVL